MSTTTIRFQLKVDGSLTDATSVVLSDPTGTYGVIRTDTGATVVADATALVNQSTGVYSYSFTDPASDLTYEYYIEYVYSGATYRTSKHSQPSSGDTTAAINVGTGGGITVATARQYVRDAARNAGDPTAFPNDQIDRVIQSVCNRFILKTRSISTTTAFTINDGITYTTFTTTTGFRPDRVVGVYLTDAEGPLEVVPFGQYQSDYHTSSSEGEPVEVAFKNWSTTSSTAYFYPTPDDDYTGWLEWVPQFTYWTPGSGDSTTLNIPDDVLQQILITGVPARLQWTDPEQVSWTRPLWQEYEKFEASQYGQGNHGAKSFIVTDPLD